MVSMHRLKERAIVLPIAAFFLLTPPMLLVFNSSLMIFGIPILYIYVFFTWMVLMVAGFFLARALQKSDEDQQADGISGDDVEGLGR